MTRNSMQNAIEVDKGKVCTDATKSVTMPCPAWCGTCKADADYCGDPITVSYTEAESGRLDVQAVTPCQYHTPGDRWDSPYTFDDLTERLLVELERRWVA